MTAGHISTHAQSVKQSREAGHKGVSNRQEADAQVSRMCDHSKDGGRNEPMRAILPLTPRLRKHYVPDTANETENFIKEKTMPPEFDEIITSHERLREIVKEPSPKVSHKAIDHVDGICARFIAASPFVIVATRGRENRFDLSPKGDPAGFVTVLNPKTLAPDRLGNNRVDTCENLLVHPEVGLIFLIPGIGDTLRVSGTARIVRDTTLQKRLAMNGRIPNLVLVVTVEEAFMHCAKCMVRSKLWIKES